MTIRREQSQPIIPNPIIQDFRLAIEKLFRLMLGFETDAGAHVRSSAVI